MKIYYFAYGSNMDPCRMIKRSVCFSRREHAILEGWKLVFNKVSRRNQNEGFANIEREEGSIVEGILYEIECSDLKELDTHEKHYERECVKVKLDSGEEVEAVTYIANKNWVKEGLKPSKEYLRHLLKGCDLLSEEYCKRLKELYNSIT